MKKVVLSVVAIVAFTCVAPSSVYAVASCSSDYNGQRFGEKPEVSSSLCATGSPSGTIEGDGSQASPWKWHCYDENGNQGERCEAFVQQEQVAPVSCELIASENVLTGSGSTTLSWSTENANSVEVHPCSSVDDSFKSAGPNGSHFISGIDSSRCYAVTAYGEGGSSMCTVDITVNEEEVVDTTPINPGGDAVPVEEIAAPVVVEEKTSPVASSDEDESEDADDNSSFTPSGTCSEDDYSDIKGRIWHDDNRNGKKDSGERYIEDVTVELLDEDGNEIEEDKTRDNGEFRFRNYAPGKYIIDVKNSDSDLEGMHVVYEPDNNRNGKDRITLKCDNDHTGTSFGYDNGAVDAQDRPTTLSQTGGTFWGAIQAFFTR